MSKRDELAKWKADKMISSSASGAKQLEGVAKEGPSGAGGGGGVASGERDTEDAEFATNEEDDPDKFAAFGRYFFCFVLKIALLRIVEEKTKRKRKKSP